MTRYIIVGRKIWFLDDQRPIYSMILKKKMYWCPKSLQSRDAETQWYKLIQLKNNPRDIACDGGTFKYITGMVCPFLVR